MTTRSLSGLAVLLVVACATAAVVLSMLWAQLLALSVAIVTTFLLGIGLGERSNTKYCRELARINRLLSDYADELSNANLRKLSDPSAQEPGPTPPA